ncbi:plasmid replication protein RepC [Brucella anthropi]|uniref:plasmid replication protein RepC n=1 Tax=Brucella anthropi TaxID=529 RepID=UPI001EEDEFF1|nr:plasmid replication protein RepC [Brucella anthropi]
MPKRPEETGKLCESLEEVFLRFREVVDAIPRRASLAQLATVRTNLETIRGELDNILKAKGIAPELSGSVAQFERQHIESLPESLFESQNGKMIDLKAPSSESLVAVSLEREDQVRASPSISLDQVLRTCPDIRDYGINGIGTWRELLDASRIVSGFLGISRSAYQEAVHFMGAESASTAIAWILQKLASINSPGGYLRSLTEKARGRTFSISQLLFSGMNAHGNLDAG